ncbi:addiction module antidote protein [Candidatus Poriferisodalis sp.]|uniref:addiction module antidote protein n=1 Tax=Candidatus Poriferisodalis sp. TaxID=3101277 RepID=UPI003B011C4C
MASVTERSWEPADHLATPDDARAYLNAALETGETRLIAAALGDIARSEGMSKIAAASGLGRESLYKSLSTEGNPAFSTVLKVLNAFDLRLHAIPVGTATAP